MGYDLEKALLTKMLEVGDARPVIKDRVTAEFFSDEDNAEVFDWLVLQQRKHKKLPSLTLLQREFPDFEPEDTDDNLALVMSEVKREKLYRDMAEAVKEVTDATRDDPEVGFERFRTLAARLSVQHAVTRDEDITKAWKEMKQEYKSMKKGEGMLGLPYPWKHVNGITQGMHNGDLIGIYARPKSLKTWISLYIAVHVHQEHGLPIVYFSCEMPVLKIRRRIAAMTAKVSYSNYMKGALSPKEEKRFYRALKNLRDSPSFMVCKVESSGEAAMVEIEAKLEEYKAAMCVIDGAYFLMEEDTHQGFRKITRGSKEIADRLDIPVLITTQANREAEKTRGTSTREVAFGDSLAQDCDQLFRIVREQQHKEAHELLMVMPAMREASENEGVFTIHAKPADNFGQKHIFSEDEAEAAIEDTDQGGSIMGGTG